MQNTIKLLFFTAVWRRPEITEICFMGLKRLQKVPGFQIDLFAVISEESMIPLCEKYGVEWCMHENLPLGAKKNYGLSQAMKKEFDYLVEIGSDDIFKNEFLNLYTWDRDIFTLSDFIMMNTKDGECRRLNKHHAHYGTGRAISRRALEALNAYGRYAMWTDAKNKGLDNDSTYFLARRGFMDRRMTSANPVVLCLKSEVNIWPFENNGIEYSEQRAFEGLSEEEVNAIKCYRQKRTLESVTGG